MPPPSVDSLSTGWDQQALAAQFQTMQLQQPASHNWYFDTGATNHVTSDAGILPSASSSISSPSSIIVGDGSLIPVTSTRSASLPHNLRLNDVLVAPNLTSLRISFLFVNLLLITTAVWNLTHLAVL
jgi:hypothetical protein